MQQRNTRPFHHHFLKQVITIAAGLGLALFSLQPVAAGTVSYVGHERWVTVEKVYDGDTFRTTDGEKIRLLGINTPETAHGSEAGEPLGNKAKTALKKLVLGQQLRLQFDRERKDRYGRFLAQAFLRDGSWVNGQLIATGMAHVYTFAPNFKWSAALLALERKARQQKRGIWKSDYFKVLSADKIDHNQIGRFRLVQGYVDAVNHKDWRFRMGELNISIPRKYRQWFKNNPNIQTGQQWLVRGKIRISNRGKLYLALHSPFDMEKMN